MTRRNILVAASLSLMLAFVIAPSAMPSSASVHTEATLGVSFSYTPNTVTVNSPTTGMYSITGGTGPYTITVNGAPSGCNPQPNPFTTSNASDSFTCYPKVTGNFNVNVNVVDSLGNSGSASASLTVNGNTGGTGGGSGSNGTGGGFNLSGLQDLLPIVMIVGIVFLAATVAIAASAVALAVLVPRRLKQIRKAIEGQPMKKPKEPAPAAPAQPAQPAPKDDAPKDDL